MGMGKQEEEYEITSSWWCVINRKRSGDTRVDFALRIRQLRLGLKMMTDRINIKNLGNPHLSADRVSFFIIYLRKNKIDLIVMQPASSPTKSRGLAAIPKAGFLALGSNLGLCPGSDLESKATGGTKPSVKIECIRGLQVDEYLESR